jgi:hypothetical protein
MGFNYIRISRKKLYSPYLEKCNMRGDKNSSKHHETAVVVDTGEVMDIVIHSAGKIASPPFVKIYQGAWFSKLNLHGYRTLFYVLNILKPNRDWVEMDMDDFMAHTGFDKNTWYKGVEDMIENNLLFRGHKKNRYIVNTSCFFNGKGSKFSSLGALNE